MREHWQNIPPTIEHQPDRIKNYNITFNTSFSSQYAQLYILLLYSNTLSTLLLYPTIEATNLVWRLPRRRLRSLPTWSGGACLLANLPSKNMLTTTQQCLSTRLDLLIGQQQPPWCLTPCAAANNSQPACWLIVACNRAGSGALWQLWEYSGRHGQWGTV